MMSARDVAAAGAGVWERTLSCVVPVRFFEISIFWISTSLLSIPLVSCISIFFLIIIIPSATAISIPFIAMTAIFSPIWWSSIAIFFAFVISRRLGFPPSAILFLVSIVPMVVWVVAILFILCPAFFAPFALAIVVFAMCSARVWIIVIHLVIRICFAWVCRHIVDWRKYGYRWHLLNNWRWYWWLCYNWLWWFLFSRSIKDELLTLFTECVMKDIHYVAHHRLLIVFFNASACRFHIHENNASDTQTTLRARVQINRLLFDWATFL